MDTTGESINNIRAIVIDDNEDWCNTVRLLFKLVKAMTVTETVATSSIKEALQIINDAKAVGKPFSVAIIDMQLDKENEGDQSGKNIIRFIKREHPYIACIIATGQSLTWEEVLDLRDDFDLDYCLPKDNVSAEILAKATLRGLKRVRSKGVATQSPQSDVKATSMAAFSSAPSQIQEPVILTKHGVPKVFISYAHRDEDFKIELVSMLSSLRRQGIIEIWQDREIKPGDEWHTAIRTALEECQIALLLVSVDFLNSEFISKQELPVLFQRRRDQGLRAIPIIVRDCPWEREHILKDIQALPKDGRAINSFRDRDKAWKEIVKEIERLATEIAA